MMNRKKFIQTTGWGLGVALMPAIAGGKRPVEKSISTEELTPKIISDTKGRVFNVLGDVQTHKLVGSETGNQLVEWVSDVEPGVGIPPHVHTREDEVFRVIKGQVEIMVNGEKTVLHAGDIAFAPKNVVHAWTVVGTEKAKMIASAFPAGIEPMFGELAALPSGPPDFAAVARICKKYGITFV